MPVYLDYNATTPVDPAVVDAMLPYLREQFGNPSSTHSFGKAASAGLEKARAQVAALLSCKPEEVVFTSCATESSNFAIKGIAFAAPQKKHVITSEIEHPATAASCRFLEKALGFEITRLKVDGEGQVRVEDVKKALRPETALVTLIHGHNETGVLQPIQQIASLTRAAKVPFHVDAAQSIGKFPVSIERLGCDLLTVAGHKLYAPKGVGALIVREGITLEPLLHGASYERGRRGGTWNVAQAVALGAACELAQKRLSEGETARLVSLRDRLFNALAPLKPTLFGHRIERLPNTLYLAVPGLRGAEWLEATPDVAASTGSACHAGIDHPSAVLTAMGVDAKLAMGAVRLSVGRYTTGNEVDAAAAALIASAKRAA